MKKFKFTLSILAITTLLFTGCGNADNKAETKPSEKPVATGNTVNADIDIQIPKRTDGTIALSLGFSTALTDPRGVASEQLKNEVEKNTNGSVVITLYPDSQKGSDSELINSVTTGLVDMTVSSAGNFTGYVNEVGISALPFLFDNFEQAWKFMDSTVVKEINKNLEDFNIHVLAHYDNGFRCVTTKDKPINVPDDMVGLAIRTPNNAVVKETMASLNALPQVMDFSQVYDALKNGSLNAQENPIPIIYNSKLYEVQNCLSITNHSYDAMPLVISKAAWDALTPDEQQVIQTAAINAQNTNREIIKKQTEQYIAKLENECHMTITHPDLSLFKDKTKDVKNFFNYDQKTLDKVTSIIQ